ncbi:MAG UNVERIFIED_CONTAM: hypothetical protein LVR18_07620 [Planctomycetaceae bacterium]
MNIPEELLHGYLDQTLDASQQTALQHWLSQSPENMRRFTELLLLHNQLRSESLSFTALGAVTPPAMPQSAAAVHRNLNLNRNRQRRRILRRIFAVSALLLLLLVLFDFLSPFGRQSTATAASGELSRLIRSNQLAISRTYQIEVENMALAGRRHNRKTGGEKRPPKPPMDNALLHVRGGGLFVLVRYQSDGQEFITGCDGTRSWAVRPGSPVRISGDLQRFSRDLPGHEYSLSLVELTSTLQQLQKSCDVQIFDGGSADDDPTAAFESTTPERLLIAVRRPGFQGPRRVEVAYAAGTHEIHQIRFIDMPYGPERLTLRLTLNSRETLPESFLITPRHHSPDLPVEQE